MSASIDDKLAVWVATHRFAPLNDPFVWLGTIEKLGAIWIGLALITALLMRRGLGAAIAAGLLAAGVTFAADGLSFGLKDLVQRPRPFVAHPEIHPLYVVRSSSFPAGHAATAFAGATVLSWLVARASLLFVALAVAIGSSRVYVGDHYPTDVLAGAAIGIAVGFAAILLVRVWRRRSAGGPLSLRTSNSLAQRMLD
jgi:undecaprenyl-diphosphatase